MVPGRTDWVGNVRTGPSWAKKGWSVPGRAGQDLAAPGTVSKTGQPQEEQC